MRRKKKTKRIWYVVFAFVYFLFVGFFLYFNRYGYRKYTQLGKKIENLNKTKSSLNLKKEMLKKELELQNASSPFFIEMIARERLRMAKEGEIIYIKASGKNKKKGKDEVK